MYKQSPSRNYRSKGIKVKQVLQIFLLLAVCFWLIYQVKRSHEKRKEFDEKEAKLVADMERAGEIMKFGRKDLTRLDNVSKDEKLVEDNEENEGEEEDGKPEEDEQDQEETKVEEKEEDEDELTRDEHDMDRSETETEHDEEFMEEEKGREEEMDERTEESRDEGNGSHSGNKSAVDEQDHDGATKSNHEAQEELYKADDASSEVAHDTPTSIPDRTETSGTREQSEEDEASDHGNPTNATTAEVREHIAANLTNLQNSSHPNSTLLMEFTDQAEDQNKTAAAITELNSPLLSNGTQETSNTSGEENLQVEAQGTGDDSLITSGRNLSGTGNTTELANAGGLESLSSPSNTTIEAETTTENMTKAGLNEDQSDTQEQTESGSGNVSSESQSMDEKSEIGLQDPIDESDSSVAEDDKEARMDLSTLPEIQDNVDNTDEAAEE